MKKLLFISFLTWVCFLQITAQSKHVFSFKNANFVLDNKPFQIISGELHPARIPKLYWRQRIQMVKAMGCNTIAVYIFWNYHELKQGQFDFISENRNIAEFIRICKNEGMWVLLRPGPYVCAEWDFGGLPYYLLKIPGIKVRCMDKDYMVAVSRYINRLAKEVAPLQCINGGPILMVQVENEYGSYGNDKNYLEAVRKVWKQNGIRVPFYTADGATPYMLEAGNINGAAIGLDSGGDEKDFAEANKRNPVVPSFSSETYPGWLTHWGEQWARTDTDGIKKELIFLLKNKKSFNLYVAHGGTNFGFNAGANAGSATQYQPTITSYDYDAPINEQGRPTAKYFTIRNLIAQYVSYKIPPVPLPVESIEIPSINMIKTANLWNYHLPVLKSVQPKPIEYFDQNQGLILYKTRLVGHKYGKLKIFEPHDYALIFVDGKFIDTIHREGGRWEVKLPNTDVENPELEILVEGMGHINFGQFIIDRKGITDRVTLNGMTLMNWEVTLYPMNETFIKTLKTLPTDKKVFDKPCNFFMGSFDLEILGDVYFDMSKYVKGMIYVNGHNLGRFWNIGPQQRLYCPVSCLHKGNNEIIVFDFFQSEAAGIEGKRTLF